MTHTEWKQLTLDKIELLAKQLLQNKQSWHFHLLTVGCKLNNSTNPALILESPATQEVFVCYCHEIPTNICKKLAELLHTGCSSLHSRSADRIPEA